MTERAAIGVLAGMGPRSTAPFVDMLVDEAQRQLHVEHQEDYPPMMIYALPAPIRIDGPTDDEAMRAVLRAGIERLQRSNVALIAMPCNTAHRWFDALTDAATVPVLNLIEEAARCVTSKRVLLVATRTTLETGLYQRLLAERNVDVATPEQREVDTAILSVLRGDRARAAEQWAKITQLAVEDGRDLLVGCTELSTLARETRGTRVIDATIALAAAAIREYARLVH